MDIEKRDNLIQQYKMDGGIPGIARLADRDREIIRQLREREEGHAPSWQVLRRDDGLKTFMVGPWLDALGELRPDKSVYVGPLYTWPERYERMNGADAAEELFWLDAKQNETNIRTVDGRAFFDGNTDETSHCPQPTLAPFSRWRDVLLSLADHPDTLAVRASVFDLPEPGLAADDDRWLQAEMWFVWARTTPKILREWLKPLQPRYVMKVGQQLALPPVSRVPQKTYLFSITPSDWYGIPERRCRGAIYTPPAKTYAPQSPHRMDLYEVEWRSYRERLVPSLDSPLRETVNATLDAFYDFQATGIPCPGLWQGIESMLRADVKRVRQLAVEWLWHCSDLTEAAERLWHAYERGNTAMRLMIVQNLRHKNDAICARIVRAGLIDRSKQVRLFSADRAPKSVEADLIRALQKETDARARRTMEYSLKQWRETENL